MSCLSAEDLDLWPGGTVTLQGRSGLRAARGGDGGCLGDIGQGAASGASGEI